MLFESHGTPKDLDPHIAALAYCDAAFNLSVMASWEDAAIDDEHIAWAGETGRRDRTLVSQRRLRQLYAGRRAPRPCPPAFGPDSIARLQSLKFRYDPDNLLHRNQNIPPSNSRA